MSGLVLKARRLTPARIIIFGFLALILFGALLLTLPVSTRDGLGASFEDALFTATSATCVTGLVVQDTYTYWSPFGQAVVLALIQIGGMGVVTMALAIFTITGRRIGLKQRVVMQETVSAPHVGGMVRLVGFIVRGTLLVEGAGAVVLALRFCPQFGFGKGLWFAVFHSVSAFCNAGFDLMGESGAFSSLVHYSADPLVNIAIMALITIGGIGFFVWDDLLQNGLRFRRYRLQTKLVLVTSGLLIVLPAAYLYFVEFSHPQWAGLSAGERVLAALFQSVTTRTAGFNTIDQTALSGPALMLCTLTMLVGGSPGSTAGRLQNHQPCRAGAVRGLGAAPARQHSGVFAALSAGGAAPHGHAGDAVCRAVSGGRHGHLRVGRRAPFGRPVRDGQRHCHRGPHGGHHARAWACLAPCAGVFDVFWARGRPDAAVCRGGRAPCAARHAARRKGECGLTRGHCRALRPPRRAE